MDGVSCLHIVVRDVLVICQGLSCVDQTNHGHIDSFFLLQGLLDLQNCVRGLEVKRLLHASQSLLTQTDSDVVSTIAHSFAKIGAISGTKGEVLCLSLTFSG